MKRLIPWLLLTALLAGCTAGPNATPPPVEEVSPVPTADAPEPGEAPATPAPEPTEAPTPVPTPEPVMYKSRVNTLNFRSEPSTASDGSILGQLGYEDEVEYLSISGEFTLVRLGDGREVYCFSDYLVPAEAVLYAHLSPSTAQKTDIATGAPVFEEDGVTPVMVKNDLVDLRLFLPEAEYELLFATERNILAQPLYPRAIPLMQRDTVKKLQKAYDLFKADGYTLKVYDAYRPVSVQKRLFDKVQNRHWIANPATTASNHNRGCAIDLSLIIDATGAEIVTPTPMHTFTDESARTCKTWSEEARANVEYITAIMKKCGFNSIESEWWHYADTDSKTFMTTDIDLGSLNMLPKEEEIQ